MRNNLHIPRDTPQSSIALPSSFSQLSYTSILSSYLGRIMWKKCCEGFSAGSGIRKGWFSNTSLHNRVENLADVSTRCSGLLEGFKPCLKRRQGFIPVVKLVLENQSFLEKMLLQYCMAYVSGCSSRTAYSLYCAGVCEKCKLL